MIEFRDVDCFLPEDLILFKPIRFEEVKRNGIIIAYVAWKNKSEPHVEYFDNVSARAIYEATIAFINRDKDIVIKSFLKTKNLFDRISKKCGLEFCELEKDEFDRGFTFNYKVKR